MPVIGNNLGNQVTTRTTSWSDMCHRAWGGEFYAPDPGIYEFSNGKKYDSTDKGQTGIYGVYPDFLLLLDGTQYPDMRDSLVIAEGFNKTGAANNGFGSNALISGDS